MGAAFGARTLIAEFMPRLMETALEAVPVAELRPWPRGTSLEARDLAVEKGEKKKLAGGNPHLKR